MDEFYHVNLLASEDRGVINTETRDNVEIIFIEL